MMIRPIPAKLEKMQGLSLVTAICMLLVLATLSVAVMSISGNQQRDSALDLQGARAYQAARAGVEWGISRVAGGCFASPTSFALTPATLSSFTVNVTCTPFTSNGVTVYRLISTACNYPVVGTCPGATGNPDYVERVVEVTF